MKAKGFASRRLSTQEAPVFPGGLYVIWDKEVATRYPMAAWRGDEKLGTDLLPLGLGQ